MIEMGEFRAELESSLASFNEQKAEKADAAKKRKAAAQVGAYPMQRRGVQEGRCRCVEWCHG